MQRTAPAAIVAVNAPTRRRVHCLTTATIGDATEVDRTTASEHELTAQLHADQGTRDAPAAPTPPRGAPRCNSELVRPQVAGPVVAGEQNVAAFTVRAGGGDIPWHG